MIFGKPKATTPYLTRALEAIDAEKFPEAQQIIQDGAIDYFGRFRPVVATIPIKDAPLLIHLYRHMADELERTDPVAAALAEKLKPIKLPPIEYRPVNGGGK